MSQLVEPAERDAKLWSLLDDIDTLGDSIKPTDLKGYKRYFEAVNHIASKRHKILDSDGHNLYITEVKHNDKHHVKIHPLY